MNKFVLVSVLLAGIGAGSHALAADVFADVFGGVFTSTSEGCALLEKDGINALFEHDFLQMSLKNGIEGNEYHCEFVDTKNNKDETFLVVSAYCESPGEHFPDMFSIREHAEGTLSVSSLMDSAISIARRDDSWPSTVIYYRCDNVKESLR